MTRTQIINRIREIEDERRLLHELLLASPPDLFSTPKPKYNHRPNSKREQMKRQQTLDAAKPRLPDLHGHYRAIAIETVTNDYQRHNGAPESEIPWD